MISFCCGFYPWYRGFERTQEVFDVLIEGLNSMYGVEDTELCLVSAAVLDIWRPAPRFNPRKFDSSEFEDKLKKSFKGKVKYLLDKGSIHWSKKKGSPSVPRYWCSKSIAKSIEISSNDYIMIVGIDCYITDYFILDYFQNVAKGKAWVLISTKIRSVDDINFYKAGQLERKYYSARGIIGIYKKDFYKIGGYDCSYLKDRADSVFFDRLDKSDIEIKEQKVNNVYHVSHPGSHGIVE